MAFTFDDGPAGYTPRILDLLKDSEDRVTFFICGYTMSGPTSKFAGYVKRAAEEGHEVGLHTFNHKNLYTSKGGGKDADESLIKEEIESIANLYTEITGKYTYYLRPPGGNFNNKRNYGYALIMWNIDSIDWQYAADARKGKITKEEAARKTADQVLKDVQSGDIVLMHDIHETSVMAFEILYKELKDQGYRFVTVSELLQINAHEHTGQYFYSSYRYGQNGTLYKAKKSAAAAIYALPVKEEE